MCVDFVVIGVQKSGTSTLHRYLSDHPHVGMASKSELEFFSLDRNWALGLDHYRSYFEHVPEGRLRGEVSPGLLRSPHGAGRLASVAPQARLVAILRDPADRAFSAWKMQISKGSEHRDFEEALEADPRYLDFGRYGTQLRRVLEHFPRHALHVAFFHDLASAPDVVFRELCAFLGIPFEDVGPVRENPGGMPRHGSVTLALRTAFRARALLRRVGLGVLVDHRAIDRGARVLRNRVAAWNRGGSGPEPRLSPETALSIRRSLAEETRIVEEITGRDLRRWRGDGGEA